MTTIMRTSSSVLVVSYFVLAAALAGPALAQRGPRGPLQPPLVKEGVTEKISEHVYVIPDGNTPLVPNVSIIVGGKGTLVVDTGLGARNGRAIMREAAKVSKSGDLYLAVTHFHPEHDLGGGGFPATARMLRSRDQVADIDEFGLDTAKRFASFSPETAELLEGAESRKADQVFDKEQIVDLGGVRVRLMAMGANHTRGDIAVWVEPDAVLVSGDVVMTTMPGFSSPHSKLSIWLQSLDRFERLQPKRIVPSHGPMGDVSMIARWKTLMTTVQARAAELKRQGRTLDDTVKVIQDEMQDRYPRNGLAGVARAAYAEAP
jgi:glyoxylase-like metal-dependent hydrolase (beta-lactamase superfamily II)